MSWHQRHQARQDWGITVRRGTNGSRNWARRPVGILLLIGFVLLAAGCSSKKSDAQLASEALANGIAAQKTGRLADAAAAYREVLTHDPNNKFAYYNLGLIDQTNAALASSESNYRLALAIDPKFVPALYNLAIVETNLGNLDEAIDLYRQAITVQPDYADAHLNLGFALIDAGQRKEGKGELDAAVQLDPSLESRIPKHVTATGVQPSNSPAEESPSPSA
jgi:tetratricopeptide (TPR) repeat protein